MSVHTENFFSLLDSVLSAEKSRGKTDSVEAMAVLTRALGNPQNSYKIIHVTGSKGKGSVATMMGKVLFQWGKTVGVFTSPHISNFFQRITRGDGSFFDDEIYEAAAKELLEAKIENLTSFSWFELVTAFALLCFRQACCEFAVLEVGMGGRLDATNIVESEFSVITNIEMEHSEFLGDTLEKIASEKAGIIKNSGLVFSANQRVAAENVIRKTAEKKNATLFFVKDVVQTFKNKTSDNSTEISFSLFSEAYRIPMKVGGHRQCDNALLAVLALKKYFGHSLPKSTITSGLSAWNLPGRFEIRHFSSPREKGEIILDGAHTEDSLLDLVQTLNLRRNNKFILLFSCARDKNCEILCEILARHSCPSSIFLTRPGNFKKCDFPALQKAFAQNFPRTTIEANEDFAHIIEKAMTEAAERKLPLVVTGSFYLVAEVSEIMEKYFTNG